MARRSVAATVIAFFFFALSFREQPYKAAATNRLKLYTEIQIFGVTPFCMHSSREVTRHSRLSLWQATSLYMYAVEIGLNGRVQVVLVCIVLQADAVGFANEAVTIEDYGAIQTALTLALLPVVVYRLVKLVRRKNPAKAGGADKTVSEPSVRTNNPMLRQSVMRLDDAPALLEQEEHKTG